eukprot:Em0019g86a
MRIIRMVEAQKDPMDPPRFRNNSKSPVVHRPPPRTCSASPTRKVTVKEQQDWKIPPCISNWKNPKARKAIARRSTMEKKLQPKGKREVKKSP